MTLVERLTQLETEHNAALQSLQDEKERALVREALTAERRIIDKLRAYLGQMETERIDTAFRLVSTEANRRVIAAIVTALGEDFKPFETAGTQWMADALRKAYQAGAQKTVDLAAAGYGRDLSLAFTAEDAAILETALTKGYGKELRGLGKIKAITQETSDVIRDTLTKGLYERLTLKELEDRLFDAETGLASLETFDKNGVRRTLSLRQRCKLIAQNETAAIYQLAATEKARDIFGEDPLWQYGSVPEFTRMTEWCKRRFGKTAKLSEWNSTDWVFDQFGDRRTGTGHIHVNCRQSGFAVDPDWEGVEEELEDEGEAGTQEWKPAKTLKEAEGWVSAKYPNIRADFSDMEIEAVNETVQEFDRMAQLYPEVANRLEYIGGYKGVGAPSQGFSSDSTYAHASRDGKRIGLNPLWYGKTEKFRKSRAYCVESGWSVKGSDSIAAVMTHEFDHHVYNWLRSQRGIVAFTPHARASGMGLVVETFEAWLRFNKAPSALSLYATTSLEEGWAEGSTSIHHTPARQQTLFTKRQKALLEEIADPSVWTDDPKSSQAATEEEKRASWVVFERLREKGNVKI